MSDAYLGQIMCAGFQFAPSGWARCDGQEVSIQQNQALFSLLRTTFGGDGITTFRLPDLRGRTPVGGGFPQKSGPVLPAYALGQSGGVESVTLQTAQMASHSHMVHVSDGAATASSPVGGVFAVSSAPAYGPATNLVALGGGPTTATGGGGPHENMQPFQVINMVICMAGPFPSAN